MLELSSRVRAHGGAGYTFGALASATGSAILVTVVLPPGKKPSRAVPTVTVTGSY